MGVDVQCYLPHYVRVRDVADVIGACAGLEKVRQKFSDGSGWSAKVDGITVKSVDVMPGMATIEWTDLDGEARHTSYHFEAQDGKLLMPRSTPFWIAVCKRLVDFFGGELVYQDCEGDEPDYVVSRRPPSEVCPEDGDEWYAFQERIMAVGVITRAEIEDARQHAAYNDAEWGALDLTERGVKERKVVIEDVAHFTERASDPEDVIMATLGDGVDCPVMVKLVVIEDEADLYDFDDWLLRVTIEAIRRQEKADENRDRGLFG